jgi:AcrR family transcriptional regulator
VLVLSRQVARPRTPLLSRRRIAEAALDLIDAEGLDALSMRRLAARLDVEAGSLYHHVSSRDDLLDEAIAIIDETIDIELLDERGRWQDRVERFAHSYHRAFARHPEMVVVAMRRPIQSRAALDLYDRLLAFLRDAGWDAADASAIVVSLDHLAMGAALETLAVGFDRPADEYGRDHPTLAHALEVIDRDTLAERSFAFGLRALLTGLGDP